MSKWGKTQKYFPWAWKKTLTKKVVAGETLYARLKTIKIEWICHYNGFNKLFLANFHDRLQTLDLIKMSFKIAIHCYWFFFSCCSVFLLTSHTLYGILNTIYLIFCCYYIFNFHYKSHGNWFMKCKGKNGSFYTYDEIILLLLNNFYCTKSWLFVCRLFLIGINHSFSWCFALILLLHVDGYMWWIIKFR